MKLKLGGVRLRLWLATALPAMLVIALLVIGFASQYGGRMTEVLKDRGVASVRQLGSAAEFSLFAGDQDALKRLAEATVRSDVNLRGVTIFNAQGKVMASAGDIKADLPHLNGAIQVLQSKDALVVSQPVYSTATVGMDDVYAPVSLHSERILATHSRLLGHAVVEMSLDPLVHQRRELFIWSLATAMGGLMLAAVMASVMSDQVSSQIAQINRVVDLVGRGRLDERIDVTESGALRPLA